MWHNRGTPHVYVCNYDNNPSTVNKQYRSGQKLEFARKKHLFTNTGDTNKQKKIKQAFTVANWVLAQNYSKMFFFINCFLLNSY